jgi:drug/metabolite transporter (DMT)-like permease
MLPGLILALTCAVVTNASFLLRQRGAVESPDVDPRHPLRSLRGLFASRWWTIGWAAAAAAWMLHVGALALLQLSVVQAVVAGGLVFLAVLAERFFGFHLGTRQWVGLSVTAAGLAVLGVTGGPAGPGRGSSLGALIAVEGGVTIISAILIVTSIRLPRVHPAEGMILAVAAGTLFGVSDISLKYLTHAAHAHLLAGIANGWTAAALAASVVAFFASARSLQLGPPLEVIAFTSIAANLVAIGGGILVFHDSIGKGALQITGRMIAFCLVIAGAALMPAPQREREPSAPGVRERRTPPPSRGEAHPSHASRPAAKQDRGR